MLVIRRSEKKILKKKLKNRFTYIFHSKPIVMIERHYFLIVEEKIYAHVVLLDQ